jgi:chemotaxis protein CheD
VEHLINVGIADIKYSDEENIIFRTILGSCVGICIYHPQKKIGGMCHIMLPAYRNDEKSNFMKYADSAVPYLIEKMSGLGANGHSLIAKIAGGASMFTLSKTSFMADIGKNNIIAVQNTLKKFDVSIIAEDTGGTRGRTIDFHLSDGRLRIKEFGKTEVFI